MCCVDKFIFGTSIFFKTFNKINAIYQRYIHNYDAITKYFIFDNIIIACRF